VSYGRVRSIGTVPMTAPGSTSGSRASTRSNGTIGGHASVAIRARIAARHEASSG